MTTVDVSGYARTEGRPTVFPVPTNFGFDLTARLVTPPHFNPVDSPDIDLTSSFLPAKSKISYNLYSKLHTSCRLVFTGPVPTGNYYIGIRAHYTDYDTETIHSWDLGVFTLETPRHTYTAVPGYWEAEGYTVLELLDQPLGKTFTVTAGTTITEAIGTLEETATVQLGSLPDLLVTPSDKTVASDRIWPIDEKNTVLRILNDLLSVGGYWSAHSAPSGPIICAPYQRPSRRTVTRHYGLDDPQTDMIDTSVTVSNDIYHIPNRWIVISDDPERATLPVSGNGVATILNRTVGPASILARGRTHTKVIRTAATDQTAITAIGEAAAERDIAVSTKIAAQVAPCPVFWHGDIVTINLPDSDITDGSRMAVTEWSIKGDGQPMTIKLSSVQP